MTASPLAVVVALNLIGEFLAVGARSPITALLLISGVLLIGFSMLVLGYLAVGAIAAPFLNVGVSGREHPPPGR